jgi:hypothetical protein
MLAAIRERADAVIASEPEQSEIAEAARYLRNHWTALTRFVADGRLPLDNNVAERQQRSIAQRLTQGCRYHVRVARRLHRRPQRWRDRSTQILVNPERSMRRTEPSAILTMVTQIFTSWNQMGALG